jgi:hypothetical protein
MVANKPMSFMAQQFAGMTDEFQRGTFVPSTHLLLDDPNPAVLHASPFQYRWRDFRERMATLWDDDNQSKATLDAVYRRLTSQPDTAPGLSLPAPLPRDVPLQAPTVDDISDLLRAVRHKWDSLALPGYMASTTTRLQRKPLLNSVLKRCRRQNAIRIGLFNAAIQHLTDTYRACLHELPNSDAEDWYLIPRDSRVS